MSQGPTPTLPVFLVLHGENQITSRQKLFELTQAARSGGITITRLTAAKTSQAELEQTLGSDSLFGDEKIVVIEELHSLPTSARKTALIDLVQKHMASGQSSVWLWEKRALTATMLKKFSAAQVLEFKISNQLFSWLDALTGDRQSQKKIVTLFHQVLATEAAELCLVMLTRQIRQLILAKNKGKLAGAPFMIKKLESQAARFTDDQLLKAHKQLLTIDLAHKTGTNSGTLTQSLDLFLWQM